MPKEFKDLTKEDIAHLRDAYFNRFKTEVKQLAKLSDSSIKIDDLIMNDLDPFADKLSTARKQYELWENWHEVWLDFDRLKEGG